MPDFDEAEGRLKQAGGELTDDERLQREGENQEDLGELKDKAGDVKDEADDRLEDVKNKF
jgi:uncharacterized protein YjbJ (UPF0337 family)